MNEFVEDIKLPISVIIPTKNESELLPRLLKSIEAQEYKPREIIVANSPESTDNTAAIAKEFGAEIIEGGIPGVGRNRGATAATSPLLYFSDADMVLPSKTFFIELLGLFQLHNLDLGFCLLDHDGNDKENKIRAIIALETLNIVSRVGSITKSGRGGTAPCTLIKKEVFEELGGFNENITYFEDFEFFKRFNKRKYKAEIIPIKVKTSGRRYSNVINHTIGGILPGIILGFIGGLFFKKNKQEELLNKAGKLYGELGGKSDFKKK